MKYFTKPVILTGGPVAERRGSGVVRLWKSRLACGPGRVAPGTMAKKDRGFSFERSARSLQDNLVRSGPVAGASYTLIGAIILLGGIGYAVDGWLNTSPWFLMSGLGLGIVVGFYELIKVAWHR